MGTRVKNILRNVLVVLALLGPVAAQAAELTEADVKRLALEAILENPQIVLDAVAILRQRETDAAAAQTASVLSDQRQLLERDPNAPVLGNPNGDVTIVEFFDYNCPYCRRVAPELEALMAADPNIRIVMREWPILGAGSVVASRVALAAQKQGKYAEFHAAMMVLSGRAEEASAMKVARDLGLDIKQLKADMQAANIDEHLATTTALAAQLNFNGTPSFVIGDALVPGFIDQEQLTSLVAQARAGN